MPSYKSAFQLFFAAAVLMLPVLAASPSYAQKSCREAASEEFGFLVGEWKEDGTQGRISAKFVLDGCAIEERWDLGGFSAILIRTRDAATGIWHLSFVANDLVPQIWQGKKQDGTWYFYREWELNGTKSLSRTYWQKVSEVRYNRVVEQSTDGGKTWKLHVNSMYTRLDAPHLTNGERVSVESDGWKLYGDLVVPPFAGPHPAVLLLNKAYGDRKVYEPLSKKLAILGIASLRIDLRAHGESINQGKFQPPFDEEARKFLVGSEKDIVAAFEFLKADRRIDPARIGFLGSSYSGEQMVHAWKTGLSVKAFAAMSPGSFSEESMDLIDPSGAPWLFIRSVSEIALMNDVFASLRERSKSARIIEVSGKAHASDILDDHPDIADTIAVWFKNKL